MKKLLKILSITVAIECVILSAVFLYLVYNVSNSSGNSAYEAAAQFPEEQPGTMEKQKAPEEAGTFYDVKAVVEVLGRSITVTEEITQKSPGNKFLVYIPSANVAETKVKQVVAEDGVKKIITQDTLLEINLKNDQNSIKIIYEILLSDGEGTLSYIDNSYYLTNFLMTPAVYKNGIPVYPYKKAFGDPYIYDASNYYITFKTDKDLTVYAPGDKTEDVGSSDKTTIFKASNMRDFPAVIFSSTEVYSEKYGNINIHFINSRQSKEYVKHALGFAQDNIGLYPYSDFFVVKAPIKQKGMEFSGMIFLSDKSFSSSSELMRISYHEVLHQWFYGIIGMDQLNEPFFDEGLVNYLSRMLNGSEPAGFYSGKLSNKRLEDYSSREEYMELAYNESSAYFNNIHRKLGNNFYKILQKIYKEKKFKILYFDEFLKYVNEF